MTITNYRGPSPVEPTGTAMFKRPPKKLYNVVCTRRRWKNIASNVANSSLNFLRTFYFDVMVGSEVKTIASSSRLEKCDEECNGSCPSLPAHLSFCSGKAANAPRWVRTVRTTIPPWGLKQCANALPRGQQYPNFIFQYIKLHTLIIAGFQRHTIQSRSK